MAKRAKSRSGRAGYWWAGLGWGVAAGVAFGALVLAPNMPGDPGAGDVDRAAVSQAQLDEAERLAEISAAQIEVSDEAVAQLLPAVLTDTLAQRPVLILSTADAAAEDVDAVRWLLGMAAADDAGHIGLTEKFLSRDHADELNTLVTTTLPAGAQLSEDSLAPGAHAGEALGSALMLDPVTAEPLASIADRAVVLQSLRDAGFINYPDGTILPAQVIVVITGSSDGSGEEAFAADALANFTVALDDRGTGVVLAGRVEAAADKGALGLVRADEAASAAVSTVDSLAREFARGATVLAVAEQLAGEAGAYGTAEEAAAAMPDPRG